ncbi:MAG: thiamine diphosphokinase [Clostridia bacterium]|nr:thiamine diphosphokinase [Clostridia bacterium]
MRAFIYVGGDVFPDRKSIPSPEGDVLTIAADSGWLNARRLGVTPRTVVGDLDSLGEGKLPSDTELIRLPVEKDYTDTQQAVEVAIERGAGEIVIVGGISGRIDHTLANFGILEDLSLRGVYASVCDGRQRVRFLRGSSVIVGRGYKYLSVIAADEKVKGLEIDGTKYKLKNGTLTRRLQYAVSNEIEGNCALVSARKGAYYLIETGD